MCIFAFVATNASNVAGHNSYTEGAFDAKSASFMLIWTLIQW